MQDHSSDASARRVAAAGRTIARGELERLLAADAGVRLVTALGPFGYRAKRIPGSLCFDAVEDALAALEPDDAIVVYCAGEACPASVYAQRLLESRGYRDVRRYAGGLADWEAAGLPLEGELAGGRDAN